jgi:hypothetical protein
MPAHRVRPLVAEQVLDGMRACQARGMTFDEAWAFVVGRANTREGVIRLPHNTEHRRGWREALAATKAEWEAAWHNEPTAFSRAMALLDDVDFSAPAVPRGEALPRVVELLPSPLLSRALKAAA